MIMKPTLALVATLATATASYAGDLYFNGKAEYAVEAGDFTLSGGAVYDFGAVEVFTEADFTSAGTTDITFDNLEVGVGFDLTDSTQVYGIVEFDDNMEYSETTIGVAVIF